MQDYITRISKNKPTNTIESLGVVPAVDDNNNDDGETTDNTDVVDNNTNNKQHVNIF